ncbi:MAG TPA: hypothetical protein VLE53_05305 [Gemmatimonadaceae bacterium]|nr:hypothetical protein [Gemmatimonadaceae bacterium]
MSRGRLARVSALLVVLACTSAPVPMPPAPPPTPLPQISPWPGILVRAQRLAEDGRYAEADQVLAEFAVEHPGTHEGAEADFWRAMLKADPGNADVTVREQLAALDTYLAGGPEMPRYIEAQILRRLVETVDSTRSLVVAVRAAADARVDAKNDEVKRLSDELEKTVAELERIRRRLIPRADERKPPPPAADTGRARKPPPGR